MNKWIVKGVETEKFPISPFTSILGGMCTALAVGSDDVASSYSIGVLTRRQVGRRGGSRGLVKSPVIELACSDLQHTRTGDHRVKDEVARCKLRRPRDWRSPEKAHRQK